MPTQSIIDNGQCSVITNNSYDTTGTLTRADISPATPTEVLSWFWDSSDSTWNPMKTWLAHQFEMQMCGIRRMGFWDWVMSGTKDMSALWKPRSVARGPGLIEPFVLGLQDSVLNDESWTIIAGYRTGANGTNAPFSETDGLYTASSSGPLGSDPLINTGDRVIRVQPKYTLTADAQYFLIGYKVLIQSLVGGVTQTSVYRIVNAAHEAATPPTYVDLLLDAETDDNAAAWFDSSPTNGMVRLIPPNVMDVEKWCNNRINVNTKKEVPFWVQTTRQSRKTSSEYEKVRASLLKDNAWFAKFVDLSESERNRQDEIKYRRELINMLLFQEPISANQTLALWKNLEQVASINTGITVNPGTGGQLMAYRANLVGVLPQLRECGQALDHLNVQLDIKTWVETYIYPLYRARQSAGRPARSIDVFTDSDTAAQAEVAFVEWYKDRFGASATINLEANITSGEKSVFGFSWRSFKVPTKPAGVTINFIVHEAFDDLKDALGASYEQAGRYLWTVDFNGSVYPAMVASNYKTHTVGELSNLAQIDSSFACVMENPTERVAMNSTTLTMVVECPSQSRVDYGFANIGYTP